MRGVFFLYLDNYLRFPSSPDDQQAHMRYVSPVA